VSDQEKRAFPHTAIDVLLIESKNTASLIVNETISPCGLIAV
jgi:hypothetical protein